MSDISEVRLVWGSPVFHITGEALRRVLRAQGMSSGDIRRYFRWADRRFHHPFYRRRHRRMGSK